MYAIDVSKYSKNSPITQEEWQKIKYQGYHMAIVGSWHGQDVNPYALESLSNARASGLFTATYSALSPSYSGSYQIGKSREQCGDEWQYLKFCAVDCEIDGIIISQIQESIKKVEELGQKAIIYTANWWWAGINHFNNPNNFSNVPLWTAQYDFSPDLSVWEKYGGWTTLVGKQYQGSTIFGSVVADLNIFDNSFLLEGGDVNQTQINEIVALADIIESWSKDFKKVSDVWDSVGYSIHDSLSARIADEYHGISERLRNIPNL